MSSPRRNPGLSANQISAGMQYLGKRLAEVKNQQCSFIEGMIIDEIVLKLAGKEWQYPLGEGAQSKKLYTVILDFIVSQENEPFNSIETAEDYATNKVENLIAKNIELFCNEKLIAHLSEDHKEHEDKARNNVEDKTPLYKKPDQKDSLLTDIDLMNLMPKDGKKFGIFTPSNLAAVKLNFDSYCKKHTNLKNILIPLCIGIHWRAVYIEMDEKNDISTATIFDSLGESNVNNTIKNGLASVLNLSLSQISCEEPKQGKKQLDGFSCGDYVIAYACKKAQENGIKMEGLDKDYIGALGTTGNPRTLRDTSISKSRAIAENKLELKSSVPSPLITMSPIPTRESKSSPLLPASTVDSKLSPAPPLPPISSSPPVSTTLAATTTSTLIPPLSAISSTPPLMTPPPVTTTTSTLTSSSPATMPPPVTSAPPATTASSTPPLTITPPLAPVPPPVVTTPVTGDTIESTLKKVAEQWALTTIEKSAANPFLTRQILKHEESLSVTDTKSTTSAISRKLTEISSESKLNISSAIILREIKNESDAKPLSSTGELKSDSFNAAYLKSGEIADCKIVDAGSQAQGGTFRESRVGSLLKVVPNVIPDTAKTNEPLIKEDVVRNIKQIPSISMLQYVDAMLKPFLCKTNASVRPLIIRGHDNVDYIRAVILLCTAYGIKITYEKNQPKPSDILADYKPGSEIGTIKELMNKGTLNPIHIAKEDTLLSNELDELKRARDMVPAAATDENKKLHKKIDEAEKLIKDTREGKLTPESIETYKRLSSRGG